MKPGKLFAVGLSYLVTIFLFMVYPQYLAFFISLLGIAFIIWGVAVFPKYSAQFEMRLPDISNLPPDQQEEVATRLRIQGLPVRFGETRILLFAIRTLPLPVLAVAVTFVLITLFGGLSRRIESQSDEAQMLGGAAILYVCLFLGVPLIALSVRWLNERKVLNNARAVFVAPSGNARTVRYDFRDANGDYFGTTSMRFDKSWRPGELEIVLYLIDNPERSYIASSFFFHPIRRIDGQ